MGKYRGVLKFKNKWRSVVRIDGVTHHLGYFDTEEEAYQVRLAYLIKQGRLKKISNLEGEEWRVSPMLGEPIWVSNKGRVKTVDFNNMGFEQLFKFCKAWNGKYYTVRIKYRGHLVHRLVADAFIGQSNLIINHLDNDGFNNCVENLEYVTYRENTSYANGGATGIVFIKRRQVWEARIRIGDKRITLGDSPDPIIAHQLYLNALKEMGESNKYAISPDQK